MLNIGIVGLGGITRYYFEALKTMRDHGEDGLEAQRLIEQVYKKGVRI